MKCVHKIVKLESTYSGAAEYSTSYKLPRIVRLATGYEAVPRKSFALAADELRMGSSHLDRIGSDCLMRCDYWEHCNWNVVQRTVPKVTPFSRCLWLRL